MAAFNEGSCLMAAIIFYYIFKPECFMFVVDVCIMCEGKNKARVY